MQTYEWLSFVINLLVGLYFIRYYPKTLASSFRGRPIPPGFALLRKALYWLGWIIITATIAYAGYRLIG